MPPLPSNFQVNKMRTYKILQLKYTIKYIFKEKLKLNLEELHIRHPSRASILETTKKNIHKLIMNLKVTEIMDTSKQQSSTTSLVILFVYL